MKKFLQRLADELLEKHGEDLSGLCLVFPTRRAGLFFRKELSTRISRPVWSPAVYSIQDFFALLSPYELPDPLTLQFELYDVYRRYFPGESFDRFYPWGDLLLKDFEDIDKYLVPARNVFSTIRDLRTIEHEFDLPEEDLERLKLFWENFFNKDVSRLKSEFLNTWEHLGAIYHDFREALHLKNFAYEGMAYRRIAEEWKDSSMQPLEEFSRILFAGFYALSAAEEQIISRLVDTGKAELFWDADPYYTDDPSQEAGRFLRNNALAGRDIKWKEDHYGTAEKNVVITGVPLLVGQAKYSGQLLQEWMKERDFKPEQTAVVLPDENLLFPVLYALPETMEDINVTMGYPLRHTPVFQLFASLVALLKNFRTSAGGDGSYYFRDVLNVLQHPYIRQVQPEAVRNWLTQYGKQRMIRVDASDLRKGNDPELFPLLFSHPEGMKQILEWCSRILRLILESMKEQDFRFHRLESEFVYHFYTQLSRLGAVMEGQDIAADLDTFWSLFREIMNAARIPFTGEPLKGIQVMGFLETRILDFENVIILSVNEETLPASGNKPSFIPYNIRKAFSLPTFEDQHAVSAYHFYRLLHCAKRVHLLYNTETKSLSPGEKSRFLLQLKNEWAPAFRDKIHLTETVLGTGFHRETAGPIVVSKSPEIMKKLERYFQPKSDPGEPKKLSSSALSSYISCPLKFYFRYVAGLIEPEETEEDMEAATFGSVLHKTMQLLYMNQEEITPDSVNKILPLLNDKLDQALREEYISTTRIEGKNVLLRNVIRELVMSILQQDRSDAPFRIRSLEKEFIREFPVEQDRRVTLHGYVDRVDEWKQTIRIIDYKTGKVEKRKLPELSVLFRDPKYKEQFQAMLYAGLVRTIYPDRNILSGLILLRDLSGGVWYINKSEPFSAAQLLEFDEHLGKLLSELFNPSTPFIQTDDTEQCKYCPYAGLCSR